jgi:hypothetical protein
MARYKLKEGCIFVDANEPKDKNKKAGDKPFPHVFHQGANVTFVAFNEQAAFIARFIALGVDTDAIPQIIESEYSPGVVPNPVLEVGMVLGMMANYLEDRGERKPYALPGYYQSPVALPDPHDGKLKLDFSTNPIGFVNLKTPTS